MIRRTARLVRPGTAVAPALLGLLLCSPWLVPRAHAAEPEAVVVRNRLYSAGGRFELSLNYNFGLANTLTATQGPVFTLGYHLDEAWSIDLVLGYLFGGSTDLAGQAQCPGAASSGAAANCVTPPGGSMAVKSLFQGFNTTAMATAQKLADIPDLWTVNGVVAELGLRWEPVYGKISLVSMLPVHFKWYVTVDGGIAQFHRNSLDYCTQYDDGAPNMGNCKYTGTTAAGNQTYDTLNEDRVSWIASAGSGLRFIFFREAGLNLGLREYLWQDTYRVDFTANDWRTNPTAKGIKTTDGITASLFADIGVSWTF